MAKTITINNISIKEFNISQSEGEWTVSVVYSLLDADSKEWDTKRIDIKGEDLTSGQKDKLQTILTFLITKIKTNEEI